MVFSDHIKYCLQQHYKKKLNMHKKRREKRKSYFVWMLAVDTVKPGICFVFFLLILGRRHKIRQNWKEGRKKMAESFTNYDFIGEISKGKLKIF